MSYDLVNMASTETQDKTVTKFLYPYIFAVTLFSMNCELLSILKKTTQKAYTYRDNLTDFMPCSYIFRFTLLADISMNINHVIEKELIENS